MPPFFYAFSLVFGVPKYLPISFSSTFISKNCFFKPMKAFYFTIMLFKF